MDLERPKQEDANVQSYKRAENFDEGIALLKDKIKTCLNEKKSILVTLSGKTGSGKTTLANELRKKIAEDKIDITVVSTDNFYFPNSNELDLKKLHMTINKLQQGKSVDNLTPAKVILVEGVQTIEEKVVGQKSDIRTYITVPIDKRFAARLLRDKKEFLRKLTDTKLTPEFISTVQKFEAEPLLVNMDIVINNDRKYPSELELYISKDSLIYSIPGDIKGAIKIEPARIKFLEQIGIQKK